MVSVDNGVTRGINDMEGDGGPRVPERAKCSWILSLILSSDKVINDNSEGTGPAKPVRSAMTCICCLMTPDYSRAREIFNADAKGNGIAK